MPAAEPRASHDSRLTDRRYWNRTNYFDGFDAYKS
jgi:hypothetical protein